MSGCTVAGLLVRGEMDSIANGVCPIVNL